MSYHIGERVDDLKTALKACKLILEFDPEASQHILGEFRNGEPRNIWVSHKVASEDCNDFEVVISGKEIRFAPFKLLAEGIRIYPYDHNHHAEYTGKSTSARLVIPYLREKKPELYKQLVEALVEI